MPSLRRLNARNERILSPNAKQRLRDEGLIKEIEYQPQRLGELAGVILTLDGIETALGHIFTALQRERKHIRDSLGAADERTI